MCFRVSYFCNAILFFLAVCQAGAATATHRPSYHQTDTTITATISGSFSGEGNLVVTLNATFIGPSYGDAVIERQNSSGGWYQVAVLSFPGSVYTTSYLTQVTEGETVYFRARVGLSGGAVDVADQGTPFTRVTLDNKVTLTFDNRSRTLATEFRVVQNGNIVATRLIPGGQASIQTITVPTSDPVSVFAVVDGSENGVVWVADGTTQVSSGQFTPTPVQPGTNPPSAGSVDPGNTPAESPSTGSKQIWNGINSANAAQALPSIVYAEGVDKIVAEIGKTNTLLTSAEERALSDRQAAQEFNTAESLASAQAASQDSASYTGQTPGNGSPGVSVSATPPGTLGLWSIGGHTVTVSLVPDAVWSAADSLLSACRPLLLWAAVLWFIWSCGTTLDGYIQSLPLVQAADAAVGLENFVPGAPQSKVWGSAAALVAAAVLATGTLVGILHAFALSQGYGITSLFESFNMATLASAFGVLEDYIPFAALANLYVFRVGFTFLCAPIYAGASSTMRFLKV